VASDDDQAPPGGPRALGGGGAQSEDLRLNTLHRFSKHSERLLLQEYSHCEVPAGCGGVVLRWIEREHGLPVILRMAALGPIRCWLDERELVSSTATLQAGEHVLALEVTELPRANTPIAVRLDVNLPNDSATLLRSAADSRWWVALAEPLEDWRRLGHDPAAREGWSRALAHPDHESELPQDQRWRWSSLTREPHADRPELPAAAVPLALPSTRAWLRCVFTLDATTVARHLADAEARARGD
jgi:hypothetical protein